MANILLDELPKTITVDGCSVPIKTGFKDWIKFTLALFADETKESAILNAIGFVLEQIPTNLQTAIDELLKFYTCGRTQSKTSTGSGKSCSNCVDFNFDAQYIYSAFLQQYNIDLQQSNMHWWTFRALFDGLTEQTQIVKIMQFRSIDLAEIKDKSQREFYNKMKKLYAIPVSEEIQKKTDEINEILANGGDLTAFLNQ